MDLETEIVLKRYRFSVEAYHRMVEEGLFPSDVRVELLNGEIIEMTPINSPHAGTVKRLNHLLGVYFRQDIILSIQDPVMLNDFSEPEPDIAVLKFRPDYYTESHPTADEVMLVVEVADSSLKKDRVIKLPLYAAAGIREAWIVNLEDRVVEVYTQPSADGYSNIRIFRKGEPIETEAVSGLSVDELLP